MTPILITHDAEIKPIQAQLAHEQALISSTRQDKQTRLHFWQSQAAIVVSKSETRLPTFAEAQDTLLKLGWPVIARASGGAAVPQSAGTLNVSLIYSAGERDFDIETSYQNFCQPLINGLQAINIESFTSSVENSFCDGKYNLAVNHLGKTKKIVGTSQKWSADKIVLCHAVILTEIDTTAATDLINLFYQTAGSNERKSADAVVALDQLIEVDSNINTLLSQTLTKAFQNYSA